MSNKVSILLVVVPFLVCFMTACGDNNDDGVPYVELADNVLVFTDQEIPNFYLQEAIDEGENDPATRLSGDIRGRKITIIKLSGKTNHFGRDKDLQYIDYHATVPDTKVWISEYPDTRDLNIQTDETGW